MGTAHFQPAIISHLRWNPTHSNWKIDYKQRVRVRDNGDNKRKIDNKSNYNENLRKQINKVTKKNWIGTVRGWELSVY